jgi:hypothetical protein
MTGPAYQRDCFRHDMIGRQEPNSRSVVFELAEDIENTLVVLVLRRNQGEQEPGIEKYHSRG